MTAHTPVTIVATIRRTPLAERLEQASQLAWMLSCERRGPKLSVPVSPEDEYALLETTIYDAAQLVATVREYLQCGLTASEIDRIFELTAQRRSLVGLEQI
jgi:hypothetical protein